MPYRPVNNFLLPQSGVEIRQLPSARKVVLTKKPSSNNESSLTSALSNNDIITPVGIPVGSPKLTSSKLSNSPSGSPTKWELMNTAIMHKITSPPATRKGSPLSSSPNKPSPLQIRLDEPRSKDLDTPHRMLLRKKSGEIVRPVLKFKASKSEPSTPTYPKSVRFDDDKLEHVRLFLQAETPEACKEDPCDDGERGNLTISLPNWPSPNPNTQFKTVHVNSVELDLENCVLFGTVQVQNIAFHKSVNVRYTFDFWHTVHEAQAVYKESIYNYTMSTSKDVFSYTIPLRGKVGDDVPPEDEQHTMFFAVRYDVDGREFWDNNNDINYQVEFKRELPSPAKPPRTQTKFSMDDLDIPKAKEFTNSSVVFASSPDAGSNIETRSSSSTKRNFSTRYDIGASINAAKKNPIPQPTAATPPSPVSTNTRPTSNSQRVKSFPSYFSTIPGAVGVSANSIIDGYPTSYYSDDYLSSSIEAPAASSPNPWDELGGAIPISIGVSKPKRAPASDKSDKSNSKETTLYALGTSPVTGSRPNINSSSYYDLVNKYCFYGGNGSPYSTSPYSGYSSSPPAHLIRG